MKMFVSLAALALVAGSATAATVSQWDLTGAPGDQAFTAGTAAANVSATNITRGAGLGVSAAGNSFSSLGWTQQATDYISFGFSVDAGYQVNLENLYIGTRSSGTGPGTLGLYSSLDGFTAPLTTFVQVGTNGGAGTGFVNSVVDLSALPNISGTIEFRVIQIGTQAANGGATTSANGTFRLTAYFVNATFDRNLQFTGEVIPAPASIALVGLAGLVAGRRRR
ncbi:MAG: hypothetical protein AMXMBFR58_04880 [Phycisphaerae bacterium]